MFKGIFSDSVLQVWLECNLEVGKM
jgi:hypothetical protein